MGPKSNESVLIRDTQRTQTLGRGLCEDGIRVWSDMSTGLEIPRIVGSHPKLGKRHGTVFPSLE